MNLEGIAADESQGERNSDIVITDLNGNPVANAAFLEKRGSLLGTDIESSKVDRAVEDIFGVRPYWEAPDVYYVSMVSTALDKLGITEIETISPEEVMSIIRDNKPFHSPSYYQLFVFGVILYGNEMYRNRLIGLEENGKFSRYGDSMEQIKQRGNTEIAKHLITQLNEYGIVNGELDFPVVLARLRAFPDENFDYNVRLDFDPERSIFIEASRSLEGIGGYSLVDRDKKIIFMTERRQTIEDVFKKVGEVTGDLFIGGMAMWNPQQVLGLYCDRTHFYYTPEVDNNSIWIATIRLGMPPTISPILLSRKI